MSKFARVIDGDPTAYDVTGQFSVDVTTTAGATVTQASTSV